MALDGAVVHAPAFPVANAAPVPIMFANPAVIDTSLGTYWKNATPNCLNSPAAASTPRLVITFIFAQAPNDGTFSVRLLIDGNEVDRTEAFVVGGKCKFSGTVGGHVYGVLASKTVQAVPYQNTGGNVNVDLTLSMIFSQ